MGDGLPMTDRLWIPPSARRLPDAGKHAKGGDAGTYFDDELGSEEAHRKALQAMYAEMTQHLIARPDHVVYVGSSDDRHKMRQVFNHMFNEGVIGHHPTIKIDYGVPDGTIRVMEDRG